jgi:hypothetical protein
MPLWAYAYICGVSITMKDCIEEEQLREDQLSC